MGNFAPSLCGDEPPLGSKRLRQGGGRGAGVAGVVPVYKRDAEQTANNNNHFAPVALAA